MEHTDTDEVELLAEVETDTGTDPVAEVGSDPAAEAFARLEGEMALMRRAVEHLAAERADIIIPDYGATLGEMAMRLGAVAQSLTAIADKPAMQFTPKGMAERIEAAAQAARRTDHDQLAESRKQFNQGVQDMRGMVGQAHTIAGQRRRLAWMGGGGLLVGILLWAVLPGMIARSMPASWYWPEWMAARSIGVPMGEAGVRMMESANPEQWHDIITAYRLWQDNEKAIQQCRQRAVKKGKAVLCTVRIEKTPFL